MTYRTILLAGFAALAIATTRPALADVYTVTYTGAVDLGHDTYGLFGAAGTNLYGDAFTATFTYDPSQFGTAYQSNNQGGLTQAYGGSRYGNTDPLLSATLTIAGATYNQSSSWDGQQLLEDSPYKFTDSLAYDSAGNGMTLLGYAATAPVMSLTAAQSLIFGLDYQGQYNNYGTFNYGQEDIGLQDSGVTIADEGSSDTDVPEPASFALLAVAACVFAVVRRAIWHRRAAAPGGLGLA